jgi:hypothetical protein
VSLALIVLSPCVLRAAEEGSMFEAMMFGPAGTENERRRGDGAKSGSNSGVTAESLTRRVVWNNRGLPFAGRPG